MELNLTELQQLARNARLESGGAKTKEDYVAVLLEGQKREPSKMDKRRLNLMGLLLRHWKVVESQLTCPARSGDPRSCFGCPDAQVMQCIGRLSPSKAKEIEEE